jgi:hypothetical protein
MQPFTLQSANPEPCLPASDQIAFPPPAHLIHSKEPNMEPATIIAAIAAAIDLYRALAKGDDRGFGQRLDQVRGQLDKHGAAALALAFRLYDEVASATAEQSRIRARAEAARLQNPAFLKGAGTLALALIITMSAGCSRLTRLYETHELRAGYAYEWPEDASRNPSDYHTTEVDGRMVTTVPRATPTTPATTPGVGAPASSEP